jgi:putative SOS response-associated peptidase YedK
MCYHTTQKSSSKVLKETFNLPMPEEAQHTPYYHANGYDHPLLTVIANDGQLALHHFKWGLIPSFTRSPEDALTISQQTLNAKSETIFEKPAFRNSIMTQRCLIPVNGFFEWKHVGSEKVPYFIHPKAHECFLLAGVYSHWKDIQHGQVVRSFSIITTDANELMADIHNSKKRMPLIIAERNLSAWIDNDLPKAGIIELMQGCDDSNMAAHPISKNISSKTINSNVREITNPVDTYTLF